MPTQFLADAQVTGPGVPSPTVQARSAPLTEPTGVTTAAVPQAKTSVSSPDSQPACHSSIEMRPSSAVRPRSAARVRIESRVMPGSSVPVSAGVSEPVAVDEEQVHPAHLLDVAVLAGVEPDHLVAALLDGLPLGDEGRRVVAAALGERRCRRARRGCTPWRARPRRA